MDKRKSCTKRIWKEGTGSHYTGIITTSTFNEESQTLYILYLFNYTIADSLNTGIFETLKYFSGTYSITMNQLEPGVLFCKVYLSLNIIWHNTIGETKHSRDSSLPIVTFTLFTTVDSHLTLQTSTHTYAYLYNTYIPETIIA